MPDRKQASSKREPAQSVGQDDDSSTKSSKQGGNWQEIIHRVEGRPELDQAEKKAGYKYKDVNGTAFVIGKGDTSAISPNDVLQGQVGDCWFMASIIAVAAVDPKALERLIKYLGGDKYEVTIYTRDEQDRKVTNKVVVDDDFPVFTKTEVGYDRQTGKKMTFKAGEPVYAHGGDVDQRGRREIWPLLLEKAAAMVRVAGYPNYVSLHAGNGQDGIDMLVPDEKKPQEQKLSTIGTSQIGSMIDLYANTAELAEIMFMNWVNRRPMVTGAAKYEMCGSHRVMQGHVYAIVGVNVFAKTVTLQDPNGVTSGTVEIEDYKHTFGYLSVGNAIPVPQV